MKKARPNINVSVNIEVTQSKSYGVDDSIARSMLRSSGEFTIDEIKSKIPEMASSAKDEAFDTLVKIDEKDEAEAEAKDKE